MPACPVAARSSWVSSAFSVWPLVRVCWHGIRLKTMRGRSSPRIASATWIVHRARSSSSVRRRMMDGPSIRLGPLPAMRSAKRCCSTARSMRSGSMLSVRVQSGPQGWSMPIRSLQLALGSRTCIARLPRRGAGGIRAPSLTGRGTHPCAVRLARRRSRPRRTRTRANREDLVEALPNQALRLEPERATSLRQCSGLMFWLTRNRFSGSYFDFTATRRS